MLSHSLSELTETVLDKTGRQRKRLVSMDEMCFLTGSLY
jgi:hypothetical protein